MTQREGIKMDTNIGIEPVCGRRIDTNRLACVRACSRGPHVRDGKPAEVVCGYFGDWFYRVGNGAQVAPARARPSSFLSLSLSPSISFSMASDCTRA